MTSLGEALTDRPRTLARRALSASALAALIALAPARAAGDGAPANGAIEVKAVPVSGSSTPKMVVTAVVDSPPKKVWQVVSDCSHYKDRLPRVAASRLVKKSGNTFTCEVTIEMPFPLSNLTATTEAVHEESDKGMSRKWKLVRGDYKFNDGSWEVKPLDAEGKKSLVVYTVHAEPTTPIPDFIREKAQKKALPELIERVRTEAAKMP